MRKENKKTKRMTGVDEDFLGVFAKKRTWVRCSNSG